MDSPRASAPRVSALAARDADAGAEPGHSPSFLVGGCRNTGITCVCTCRGWSSPKMPTVRDTHLAFGQHLVRAAAGVPETPQDPAAACR